MKAQEETRIPEDRLWLSYPEVETITGFSRTTIWRLTKSGEIRTARYGRSVRVDRRSLEAWLEDGGCQ
jgi:excisionase family DNA binding protein